MRQTCLVGINGVIDQCPADAMGVQGQEDAPVAGALHSCPSQQRSPVEGQAQICLGLQAAAAQRGWVRAESSACQNRQTRQRRAEAEVKVLV